MSLFPGKAAGGTSGNSSWRVSLGFTLPWLSQDPAKDKIQVCASSKRGQAEVLHPGAALEAGKAVPTQGKGQGRWECRGTEQEEVPRAKFLLTRTVLLGNTWREETCTEPRTNGGLSLGWGLSQNPTNNKMWMSPLGKQGEEKIPGTCEQNCTSSRKGKVYPGY